MFRLFVRSCVSSFRFLRSFVPFPFFLLLRMVPRWMPHDFFFSFVRLADDTTLSTTRLLLFAFATCGWYYAEHHTTSLLCGRYYAGYQPTSCCCYDTENCDVSLLRIFFLYYYYRSEHSCTTTILFFFVSIRFDESSLNYVDTMNKGRSR